MHRLPHQVWNVSRNLGGMSTCVDGVIAGVMPPPLLEHQVKCFDTFSIQGFDIHATVLNVFSNMFPCSLRKDIFVPLQLGQIVHLQLTGILNGAIHLL